jgi:hypothetical protein
MTAKSDLISSVYVATIMNDVPVVVTGVPYGKSRFYGKSGLQLCESMFSTGEE